MRVAFVALLILALSLAACNRAGDGNGLPPGLQVTDLKVGDGDEAKEGSKITFHYTAWLADGTQIATSYGGEPLTSTWTDLIEGWQRGVEGMKVGGIRRLVVPSGLAYGAEGNEDAGVPPNSDMIFEIELLAVQ